MQEKETLYYQRGEVNMAVGQIIMLVVGVGVAVMVLIFVGTLGGQTWNLVQDDISAIGNNAVVNESWTPINGTAVDFAHGFIQEGTLSISNVTHIIGLDNFTVNYTAGFATLTNNAFNATEMDVNYTWGAADVRQSVERAVVSGFQGLEQTGTYLPIIVLAVVIALVLALVLSYTGSLGRGGGSGGAL